jgi:type IV secretion system protein VirB9
MRRLLLAGGLAAWAFASPAWAVSPRPGPGDPRIFVVPYDDSEVVELHGVLDYQMTLEFDPDEKIENVAIGDGLAWQVTPNKKANLLFLKPMTQRPATNMTVVTNLRRYQFELTIRAKAPANAIPYVVRFLYPPPARAVPDEVVAAPPADRNHDYTFSGATSLLPTRLFDDGQATYFRFPPGQDLPAIYTIEPDGQEALVNSRVHDPFVVIDRLARGFVLRRGKEMLTIQNHGFAAPPPSAVAPQPPKKEPWWRR